MNLCERCANFPLLEIDVRDLNLPSKSDTMKADCEIVHKALQLPNIRYEFDEEYYRERWR